MPPAPPGSKSQKGHFLESYVLSCCAATVAETGSEGVATVKRGMFRTAVGIVKEEGLFHLWQGVTPAVIRHYVYTGTRIGVYEQLRGYIFSRNPDGTFPVWKSICSGMIGGGVAQFLASPADLIKVQMQMEGRRRVEGLPPRYKNMVHAAKSIVASRGFFGLWKAWIPNCQRAALVNMADLATYDKVKHELIRRTTLKDDYITHGLSRVYS